jgi:hypothetical protein
VEQLIQNVALLQLALGQQRLIVNIQAGQQLLSVQLFASIVKLWEHLTGHGLCQ